LHGDDEEAAAVFFDWWQDAVVVFAVGGLAIALLAVFGRLVPFVAAC